MDNRTYGIELECNTNRQGGSVFARAVIADTVTADSMWRDVSIGADGSEIEIRSPIMQGADDMAELKAVMDALRGAGCKVTRADGMHVHHGAADIKANKEALVKMYESWMDNQDNIYTFVAKRRDGSGVCKRITKSCVDVIHNTPAGQAPYIDRYYGLNVAALRRGTVEFRLHQGSLRSDTAEAWIEFGKAFLDRASKEKIPRVDDPKEFIGMLDIPDNCMETLLKNAARRLDEPVVDMEEFYAAYGRVGHGGIDE